MTAIDINVQTCYVSGLLAASLGFYHVKLLIHSQEIVVITDDRKSIDHNCTWIDDPCLKVFSDLLSIDYEVETDQRMLPL